MRPRKLLVLDEPEQRLDVEGVAWLADRLVAERQRGLAIVMASHEPHLVETVATRTVHVVGPRRDAPLTAFEALAAEPEAQP